MEMIFQTRSGERRERNLKTLKEVHVGETVKVQKLTGEGPVKRRIMDMGITKGVEIYVRKVAPLYGKGVNDVNFLNFETIDGDYFAAHPGISKNGKFELFGDDSDYLCKQDDLATVNAYRKARQARFENWRVK